MIGPHADYRDISGTFGSGSGTQMFGDDAPGATWQITFLHADLGPVENFVPVPATARSTPRAPASTRPSRPKKHGGGGGGGGHGPGPGGGGGPGPGGGGHGHGPF